MSLKAITIITFISAVCIALPELDVKVTQGGFWFVKIAHFQPSISLGQGLSPIVLDDKTKWYITADYVQKIRDNAIQVVVHSKVNDAADYSEFQKDSTTENDKIMISGLSLSQCDAAKPMEATFEKLALSDAGDVFNLFVTVKCEVKEGFSFSAMKDAAANKLKAIKDAARNKASSIKDSIKNFEHNVVDGVKEKKEALDEKIEGLEEKIDHAFNGAENLIL